MEIVDLLALDRIEGSASVSSKKRALEVVSELIARATTNLASSEVFDGLLSRERLGSTGLGHGVGLPHGRLAGTEQAIGALVRLQRGIEYDAPDEQPVDLLFALIVPEQSTEEHLQVLSKLARLFDDHRMRQRLRAADDPHKLLQAVQEWEHGVDDDR